MKIQLLLVAALFLLSHSIAASSDEGMLNSKNLPDAAVTVPNDCNKTSSCASDISLIEIKNSYVREGKRIVTRPETKKDLSDIDSISNFSAAPMLDRNICQSKKTIGHYYFWAPMKAFNGWNDYLSSFSQRIRTGLASDGHIVVELAESAPGERHFALCDVTTVNDTSGPPRDCTTVAVATPGDLWVRGGNREQGWCLTSASFRNSGAIEIKFDLTFSGDPTNVNQAIVDTMKSSFRLSTSSDVSQDDHKQFESAQISAVGALRDSAILKGGWRESLEFDGYLARETKNLYSFRGAVHALVCRQAVGNIVEYHGLSSSQQASYAAEFDKQIGIALKKAGNNCIEKDSRTIICD